MQRKNRSIIKWVIFIALIMLFASCSAQINYREYMNVDSTGLDQVREPELIKVKIKRIRMIAPITKVRMKTMQRPRVKLKTKCECIVPYRKKDIVWIIKPDNF